MLKYVSKFNLLKENWQVQLTEIACEVSSFGVMPFGMKNAPVTFQRIINKVISDLNYCFAYIANLIVCSDSWLDHMMNLKGTLANYQHLILL